VFGHSFSPSDLAAHLQGELSDERFGQFCEEDTILVAEVDDRPIAFIQFGRAKVGTHESASREDFELRRVYALRQFQGGQIGSRLIERALSDMAAAPGIFLDVWEANVAAQRLYARYGFETVGRRAFRTASGVVTGFDLIMMRRAK
jgi:ribosomal protein S18 acetylase RimI-like enzyme